jgi:hypothetical protein
MLTSLPLTDVMREGLQLFHNARRTPNHWAYIELSQQHLDTIECVGKRHVLLEYILILWGRSAGSAARIVVTGRFFRLGWMRDISADARVPQLASFRLLRFR